MSNDHPEISRLLDYIQNIEKRVAVLEEEFLRWDFGYDAIETIKKRLDELYVDNSKTCSELKLNS
ncbi:uncharacterized protein METZ01_LOCUS176426 [marine metagenome]|mgnify:CR=1 FL=1|uniref:Uncharacterized protein n=1 Tax=marine metagenome TaxID=408172 RepID=A0A382CCK9_9ZZZZ